MWQEEDCVILCLTEQESTNHLNATSVWSLTMVNLKQSLFQVNTIDEKLLNVNLIFQC